jgi:hypothetical protein
LLKDLNRINELAKQLGKEKFEPNVQKDCNAYSATSPVMFTGGGYVPDNGKISISKVIPKKETYEERSKRIIQESEQYQRTEQYQRSLQPQTIQPIQDGAKLTMLEVINSCGESYSFNKFSDYADCVRYSYQSYGTVPSSPDVKSFLIFLDEIVEESNKGSYGFAKAKAEMLRIWESKIDAINKQQFQNFRQQQNNMVITAPPAIGNNCELARSQAYLTPAPSGSFAES